MEQNRPPRAAASRRIVSEHAALDALFSEARAALVEAEREAARDAMDRLRQGLEVHFEREDSLYFPSLSSLRPESREALARLGEAHEDFRRQVEEIIRGLGREAASVLLGRLETLERAFGSHERSEEELLRSLERQSGAMGREG